MTFWIIGKVLHPRSWSTSSVWTTLTFLVRQIMPFATVYKGQCHLQEARCSCHHYQCSDGTCWRVFIVRTSVAKDQRGTRYGSSQTGVRSGKREPSQQHDQDRCSPQQTAGFSKPLLETAWFPTGDKVSSVSQATQRDVNWATLLALGTKSALSDSSASLAVPTMITTTGLQHSPRKAADVSFLTGTIVDIPAGMQIDQKHGIIHLATDCSPVWNQVVGKPTLLQKSVRLECGEKLGAL